MTYDNAPTSAELGAASSPFAWNPGARPYQEVRADADVQRRNLAARQTDTRCDDQGREIVKARRLRNGAVIAWVRVGAAQVVTFLSRAFIARSVYRSADRIYTRGMMWA